MHSRTARPLFVRPLAALLSFALALPAHAATALGDQPLFSTSSVPGNLSLPLSVEFPTAVGAAHPDSTYASGSEYLGYFDPNKCYTYVPADLSIDVAHFAPAGAATAHTCAGASGHKWSGNFMNWVSMQTIDPFRWALTGGYRLVDTLTSTILEKAWASGQGGTFNFPVRNVSDGPSIVGATPFLGTGTWSSQIAGQGASMIITVDNAGAGGGMLGTYFNSIDLSGTPVLTRSDTVNFDWGNGSPGPGVNSDNFSVRWVSSQTVPTTGLYTFQTTSDDGVRLYLNGVLLINNWTDHGATTDTSATLTLVAGTPMNLRLEYYEKTGGAQIKLFWKPAGATAFSVYQPSTYLTLPIRVKVCDPSAAAGGLEANCKGYPLGSYKPEGLMQQYSNRIRYSVFGYLNDSNIQRDGGVLRARQKFIGPTYPVPGAPDAFNVLEEWDMLGGLYLQNPDTLDATATTLQFGTPIFNSGVLNYINKFGEINRGNYKSYDPVGELYYAAIRYYKNLGNVAAWSSMSGFSVADKATLADGFPVITNWGDPIQYSCQRNFILGIGDVNTHADKNVPGPTASQNEPTKPAEVLADLSVDAVAATDKVGSMQGLGANFGSRQNYPDCCNNNSPLMAGLAYDANTKDIRPDLPNATGSVGQTVQTFWVDVLEGGYKANNQFYLAAKYGGFKAPATFDPYSATAALQTSWWNTTTDMVGSQPRPDNYFTAGRPDQMVSGLTAAFASIASQIKAYTTSFSIAQPQVASTGNASYSAQYDAQTWTGEVTAGTLTFDATTGDPTVVDAWKFSTKLATQAASTGWDSGRNIVTWNPSTAAGVAFRYASISTAQKSALNTSYRGADASDYLNYLRGDRSQEQNSTVSGSSKAYRTRSGLLGDIVGSKLLPVEGPNMPFSNAANPGYSTFKSTWASRPAMVYVGANDGMLHGINGALGSTGGNEVFGYVPAALYNGPTTPTTTLNTSVDGLAALGKPTFTHHNYVNATPNVFDIDFAKTPGASGAPNWKSVLIGGLGKGGKSYYAIDVTDPSTMTTETNIAARVLWEFSDTDLGFSFGEPVVVKTKKYGWVVIFGSGYNNSNGGGYFFIVNPRTGALLEKVATGQGNLVSDAGLAFVNAYVVDRTDGTADAAYAGDLLGNLWRLDLTAASGSYPAPTRLAQLADNSNNPQPVTSNVRIALQPVTNVRYLLVGSGRALDSSDIASTQGQRFYAILDGNSTRFNASANLPTGVSFPIQRTNLVANTDLLAGVTLGASSMGWYLDLGQGTSSIGWRVVSDPATFNGRVAFASTLPNGSACEPSGSSRVYAVDFGSGKSVLTSTTTTGTGRSAVTTTTLIAYSSPGSGTVNDLKFVGHDGTTDLVAGFSDGPVKRLPTSSASGSTLRRLNWRELPLAD